MTFLLDTNVVSELRKLKPHGALIAWYNSHLESAYAISAITIFEMQTGVEVTRRQDQGKAAEIEEWIDELIEVTTVLAFGADAAREAARLMERRNPNLVQDAMIAATARLHGLSVATRNSRDFESFGVSLTNPFLFKN